MRAFVIAALSTFLITGSAAASPEELAPVGCSEADFAEMIVVSLREPAEIRGGCAVLELHLPVAGYSAEPEQAHCDREQQDFLDRARSVCERQERPRI